MSSTVLKIQSQEEYGKQVTKDIVCKIDDSEYKQRVIERKATTARNKQLKDILNKIEGMLRKSRDVEYYIEIVKEFTEKDPELAEVAKKYIELTNME